MRFRWTRALGGKFRASGALALFCAAGGFHGKTWARKLETAASEASSYALDTRDAILGRMQSQCTAINEIKCMLPLTRGPLVRSLCTLTMVSMLRRSPSRSSRNQPREHLVAW